MMIATTTRTAAIGTTIAIMLGLLVEAARGTVVSAFGVAVPPAD